MSRYLKISLTLLATMLGSGIIPSIVSAQEIKIKADIDTTRILIGDQVNIWFNVEQPAGKSLRMPVVPDTIAEHIEVLDVMPADTFEKGRDIWKIRQKVLVTSFDTGFHVIPSFYFMDESTGDSIKSNALPLEVIGIEIDTTKGITDIKLPYDIPLGFSDIWPYLLIVLALVISLVVYLLIKRYRKKPEPEVKRFVPPPVPAHIWALEQLDKLAGEKLWQQGKIKLYYSRLTDIVRRYIEIRFGIPAMEQTTYDIIGDLTSHGVTDQSEIDLLHVLLEEADLVKFAKYTPDAEDNERSLQKTYDFVRKTKKEVDLRSPEKE